MDSQFGELNPVLRDFRHAPSATAVVKTEDVWSSAVSSTFKIRSPTGPGDIDVPETDVCERLAEEIVPQIFTPSSMNVYCDQDMAWMSDGIDESGEEWVASKENRSDDDDDVTIVIEHNNLNRLLLHHAYMGFTFESAPHCIRAMLQTSKSAEEEHDAVLVVGGHYQMDEDQASSAIHNAAQLFKYQMLVFNMHMLSALLSLPSGWAFAIALESSPHFGLHGVEARLCVYGPRASQLSFHLIGVQDSQKDIERLHKLLSSLLPKFPLKLLGVVTNLDGKEQVEKVEEIISVVTMHFARLVPASRPFYSRASTEYLKQLPILPRQLWSTTFEELEKLVDQYRSMLEISWNPTEIAQIQEQHEILKKESKDSLKAGLSPAPSVEADMDRNKIHIRGRFDEEWKFLGTRFPHLRNFAGGLSTVFHYVPKSRNHVVVNKIQSTPRYFDRKDPPFLNPSVEDANIVLQACQFEELRSYLE